ncbi:hypothetical protein ACIRRH_43720 [Kitasatospora sp. NPDC101235]|uniref:hypothetical protein n=1 Tax=Kitasatospora sp. NPDC101235 TaxID=3364101 RepID=UPI003806A7C1
MSAVPDDFAQEVAEQFERIRDLAQHGLSADQLHSRDAREWFRSLLRVVGEIRDECKSMERSLSDRADAERILTPSEIAEAAKISRAALYKRRPTAEK